MKIVLLFAMVLFGVYAQQRAGTEVKALRETQRLEAERKDEAGGELAHMRYVLSLAKKAHQAQHGPFGCIVVKEGTIVGEGQANADASVSPSRHAEASAILDALANSADAGLNGATLYSAVQPCPVCISMIHGSGISKIYYSIPASEVHEHIGEDAAERMYSTNPAKPSLEKIPEVLVLHSEAKETLGKASL